MRLKLLLLFLLPTFAFGACCGTLPCNKYRACCCETYPRCSRLKIPGWWMEWEYLLLWRKARFYPPLVTTNTLGNPPILGEPGTEVLFGNERIQRSPKSGLRGDAGLWLTCCLGFGAGGWGVRDEKINFKVSGIRGDPILGRPFFNVVTALQDAQLISSGAPIFNSGKVEISAWNSLSGGNGYARYRFFCKNCFKLDLLGGYTMSRISDGIDIDSTATNEILITTTIHDHFNAVNTFYAGLLGVLAEFRSRNWGIYFTGKLGLGNMVRRVEIDGFTQISSPFLGSTNFASGLLALPTNIGRHGKNGFALNTELNAQVQLRIWEHFWLAVGYTHTLWQKVALAGNQINLNVNPTQLQGGTLVGPPDPQFNFRLSNFYIHGLTAGLFICY